MTPLPIPETTSLADYAKFLRDQHLDEVAAESLRRNRALQVPLMKIVAHLSEDEVRALTRQSMETFLRDLEEGKAMATAAASLEAWVRDELPGMSRDDVEPSDMVLVYAAQRGALLAYLERYTQDPALLMTIVRELDAHYTKIQDDALTVYDGLRRDAAARAAAAIAEKATMESALARVEAEVAARTEDLRSANEELAAQGEELRAANEELTAQGEELTAQAEELASQQRELIATTAEATQREEEAKRQSRLLERIVAQAPAGIAYLGTDLVVRWTNNELLRLFHLESDGFVGRDYLERAEAPVRERFKRILADVIQSGKPHHANGVAYALKGPGGVREAFWDFSYVAVPGDDGRTEGVLVFAQDVTSRVEHEKLQHGQLDQLRQVDRLKDEFLGALSTQLATPINTVMGLAGVLDEGIVGGALKPEQQVYIERILATCRIQLALVNDLLDLGRLSAGRLGLARDAVDLVSLADSVVTGLAPLTSQQGQRIITFLPPALPRVEADAGRIEQILTTLVFAASKLTPPGGQIRVEVRVEDGQVRCEVQDSGTALGADQVAQALERFAQLGGTWLGLSVSKRVIETLGGDLGVTPIPGTGNAFWFVLPYAS